MEDTIKRTKNIFKAKSWIPTMLIALKDDKFVWTVSLWISDIPERQDLFPFLASLFVKAEYRKQWVWRKLVKARIFLKNPKIVILDEPTSALDSISESKITKALYELTKNKTSIIIAHRLQTVMHADKIIVLENGKIENEWTHVELIKESKVYKTLVDLQNGKVVE